jgi:hypothetical protein
VRHQGIRDAPICRVNSDRTARRRGADATTDGLFDRPSRTLVDGTWTPTKRGATTASLKRCLFAGKTDGEGRNRTGDTTIFSGGSRCDRRARAELSGDNFAANRRYRGLRPVSRYAGPVQARGRQVDVARNAPRQHRSAEAHERMRQRWWVTSGDSMTRTGWSFTFLYRPKKPGGRDPPDSSTARRPERL